MYIKHLRNLLVSISAFTVIAIMLFTNAISLKADFEPCESEEPYDILCESLNRTDIMINVFECESADPLKPPCSIEVEYCVRTYSVGGVIEQRVEITGVNLINCDNDCNQHIWEGALIVLALNQDIPTPFDAYDFIYQAATCWKPKPWSLTHGISFGYNRCDEGECCVAFYHISSKLDELNRREIKINFIRRLTKMTHYCTPPCAFTNCESTSPEGTITVRDYGNGVYWPKVSSPEMTIESGLFLSPNPVDEKIDIRIVNNTRENMFIRIYDNNGLLVHEQSLGNFLGESNFHVNTSGFTAGMYNVVVLSDKDVLYNKSFIKIK